MLFNSSCNLICLTLKYIISFGISCSSYCQSIMPHLDEVSSNQISQSNFKDIKSQSLKNTLAQNIEGYTVVFKKATNYIQNYLISMKYYNWFSHSEPFMYHQYSSWTHQYFFRNQNLFATQGEYTTSLSNVSSIA